jgi:lysophospholipid acyltransferase (LPLAT)-like uncharacterized protein
MMHSLFIWSFIVRNKILSWIAYFIIWCLKMSYRFKHVQNENRDKAMSESASKSYVFSMWHQNVIPGMLSQWGRHHHILLSSSKDGDMLEVAAKKMNYVSARGSSTRGGTEAMMKIIKALKEGFNAAVTPDGPLGPPKKLKGGVLNMARESGAAILPLYVEAASFKSFNSWDKLRLPLPFTKIIVIYGEPFYVPKEASTKELAVIRNKVTEEMARLETLVPDYLNRWSEL